MGFIQLSKAHNIFETTITMDYKEKPILIPSELYWEWFNILKQKSYD